MKLNRNSKNIKGFTLVEVLVVMAIAVLLLALVLGLHGRVKAKQMESKLQVEMVAIELALENYKSDPKNGQYPVSKSWAGTTYPLKQWGGSRPVPPNRLYEYLCNNNDKVRPFLPDVKAELVGEDSDGDGKPDILLSSAPAGDGTLTKWNYNSFDPKYNKNTYDLWVEIGDYGEDGKPGTPDDVVRVISNWSN
jgi:prepilin-type N-terminal cleavage/methylation domain-containing protein